MLKVIGKILVIVGLLTFFSAIIPDPFTASINNAIIWFLATLQNLAIFINPQDLYNCISILSNTALGLATFWFFDWLLSHLN